MNPQPRMRSHERRRHWLCIAYAFPPINRSGTHRTLGFVRHLDRLGWDATVLTVEPNGEPLDESLARDIPDTATVIRTPWENVISRIKRIGDGWWPRVEENAPGSDRRDRPSPKRSAVTHGQSFREWVSRWLTTPDSRTGWIAPGVRAGLYAVRRRRPDVIYSTSPYMSAHVIALLLNRWSGIPWVVDLRDPWGENPFRGSEGTASRDGHGAVPGHRVSASGRHTRKSLWEHWDGWLERTVLRRAAHVICTSPAMTDRLGRRYRFVARKCSTILNGCDEGALRSSPLMPTRLVPRDHFAFTHCGQFYGPRSPLVWFAALRRALDRSPDLVGRVHLVLVGADSFAGRPLRDWATNVGVGGCVRVLGQRTHAAALSYMAGSDALMLAGVAGSDLQIPNKLFEYLEIQKPMIVTCGRGSPIRDILHRARASAIVCEPADECGLASAMTLLATGHHPPVQRAWQGVSAFDRGARAAELAGLFQRITLRHKHPAVFGEPTCSTGTNDPIAGQQHTPHTTADLASACLSLSMGNRDLPNP